jgi:hypothetical protein
MNNMSNNLLFSSIVNNLQLLAMSKTLPIRDKKCQMHDLLILVNMNNTEILQVPLNQEIKTWRLTYYLSISS